VSSRLALILVVGACGGYAPTAPPIVRPAAEATPELTCRDAIEQGEAAKLEDRDVKLAIGQCEVSGWTMPARKCIAAARTTNDLASCEKKFDLGRPSLFAEQKFLDEILNAAAQFRDQMCACTDQACARRVSDDMRNYGQEQNLVHPKDPEFSNDELVRYREIMKNVRMCTEKALGVATP